MKQVKWNVGQLIHHKRFGYRGVVYDVDAEFMLSEQWYEKMATSHPPKDEPWYRVLVDGADIKTYVAQCNLEPDSSNEPIEHPDINRVFKGFDGDRYVTGQLN